MFKNNQIKIILGLEQGQAYFLSLWSENDTL